MTLDLPSLGHGSGHGFLSWTVRCLVALPTVSERLDLTIVCEPGEDGWIIASVPAVAGVFSQGQTRAEARSNVIDALGLMLSPEPRDGDHHAGGTRSI
jgi:predicted RNase H-like HicB family nuclease